MMRVWSHRPRFLHLGLFITAYVLGCGFAQLLAIVPGTGISIWLPSGLFIATLVLAPGPTWPWWVLAGCLAELFGNVLWFHSPLPAALLIYAGNALEAIVGAWLVNRTCRRPVRLETLQEVLAFVVLAAGVAPLVSATVGAATVSWFGMLSQTFVGAWPLFWIGDATGVLMLAPLALVVFQNWRGRAELSAARSVEAGVLGLIFLGVAALSLSGYLPFAYIIMPPLLWAAVRFEFRGAAVALALLALITAVFTISGASQFAGDPESQRHKQVMLQLFLAISAFSALIVAAISRQHQQALLTLREHVQALGDRERELSQLVNMVPSHVWRLTPDGEPSFFNKRMIDFLGMDVADTAKPGMSRLEAVMATVHPEDVAAFRDALYHSLVTGESFVMRYRLRRADDVYRWMSSRAEPLRDSSGCIVQWYGLCHDIDDQMRAEDALRQSEQRYRHLFHQTPVALWQLDGRPYVAMFEQLRASGVQDLGAYIDTHPEFLSNALSALIIEEVNDHAIQMFGARDRTELIDDPTHWMWRDSTDTLRRSMESRWRGEESFQEPTKLVTRDGRVIDVLYTVARPPVVEGLPVSLVSMIDLTERVRAQEELRLAQERLAHASQAASLAELSASIAHEVNQPLAAIVANSHACHRWLSADPANVERAKITAERIIRDANGAADVVSRIRALFKHSVETRTNSAFASVIAEARDLMAEEAARRRVRMDVDVASDLPLVALDRVQIQQVLINLIRNGIEAMDCVADARVLDVRACQRGDVVQTEISDCGRGIKFPDKIFEPFFTTKQNGMGMGLAICRSIVESHGGRLWTERNEPRGATFVFTLPVEAKAAP